MKKEIADMWVEALRSGKYKQAQGMLEEVNGDESRFCCLGVLCQLAIASGVEIERGVVDNKGVYGTEPNYLPGSVLEWAGMYSPSGATPDRQVILSYSNDTGTPFEGIADLIEANVERL